MKLNKIRKNIAGTLALLKIGGLWSDGDKDLFETRFYWMYSMFIHVVIGGSFNLGLFVYLLTNLNNLELLAGSGCITLCFIMPLVKSVFYLKGWSLVKNLVKQLDQEDFQPRSKDEADIVFSNFRGNRLLKATFTFALIVMYPVLMLSPILIHSAEPMLPFASWYPFNFRDTRYYKIAYVHQNLGFLYTSFVTWNLDMITFGLMACLAAECDILSHRLRNVCLGSTMEQELIIHMGHHRKILKFAEDTNNFLGTLNFVQFASTSLTICMTMFELSVLPPLGALFLAILVYQCSVSCELLIYSYFGNNVYSKSVEISDALYAMPWSDGSESFKKNTLFFIMRTQRPIKMMALDVFLLSLPTFTSIMRSSWSYFAMLHQSHLKKAA